MIDEATRRIVDAVLFEGYMLYPYRASALKNRQRWNFGTLYPRDFAQAQRPEESWSCHAEFLLESGPGSRLDFCIRFLQLVPSVAPENRTWECGIVRNWTLPGIAIEQIHIGLTVDLTSSTLASESAPSEELSCAQTPMRAAAEIHAEPVAASVFRIAITVANLSPIPAIDNVSYTHVRPSALTSAHVLLHAHDGVFLSLIDPPHSFAAEAARCRNRGLFPVLVGEAGNRSDLLCSPIILYDHPQISSESAGYFFDSTEIDEMLALRVLTLSDEEKREIRGGDVRVRAILERTETLADERLLNLHGVLRGPVPSSLSAPEIDGSIDPWSPFEEKLSPLSVLVRGIELRAGDRVRLRPRKRADILDSIMDGSIAIIEAIEQDLENNFQLAVVLEDDPGKDLGLLKQPGHRFFFAPEEVEPLSLEARS
jgi:hypothetical protein